MSCEKFRILLSAYLDQEISNSEQKELIEHLKTCPDCRRELEYLKKIKKIFLLKERKQPREFFESRLFELIRDKRKELIWQSYSLVFRRTLVVILIFFLVIVGWINYKKLFHRTTEIISDILINEEIDENFQQELLLTYYGPQG
jgi:predicted anti-sigma-YlaC factor YlaD